MHEKILKYLIENGIDCSYDEETESIRISVNIDDICLNLMMRFPQYYPYVFPDILLADSKGIHVPHRYTDNKLCLYDTNEVAPSPEKYLQEALDCVKRAEKLLKDSKKENNLIDYNEESVSYWNTKAEGRVDFLATLGPASRIMSIYETIDNYYIMADTEQCIEDFVHIAYKLNIKEIRCEKALYINIECPFFIGIDTMGDIYKMIPKKERPIFHKFLIQNSGKGVVTISVNNGDRKCLFALKINLSTCGIKIAKRNVKGIIAANQGKKFVRLKVRDFQINRLFTRGGDGCASFDKNCLIVGCGSVGSYLSKAVVDIGIVKELTLLDDDVISDENVARHLCGCDYLLTGGTPKVEAVRKELLKQYPTLNCTAMDQNVLEYILNDSSFFNKFDIIFICVGNTAIEKKIIQMIEKNVITKECILLWVEPYLVAGHSLILQSEINDETKRSIFDCDGNFIAGVLENSRQYLKSEAGCQSAYAPYAGFEVQKFVHDFLDAYYRRIYPEMNKHNYEMVWLGRMKWARKQKMNISPMWRAKEDRLIDLRRVD